MSKAGKQVLVIDLGSYSIKFVVASSSGDTVTVSKAFSVPVPEDTYVNGIIKDYDAMVQLIKQSIRTNSVKVKDAVVTFSSTEIITRNWTAPKLNKDDMMGLIRYEVSQYLPIDVDDYDVSFKILSTVEEDGVEKYNLDAYIVKKSIISSFYNLIKDAGLTPLVLDVHSNCISKIANIIDDKNVSPEQQAINEKQTKVFIDIGYQNILVDIFSKDEVGLSRVINKGFFGIDKMISEKLDVKLPEAEELRVTKFSSDIKELVLLYEKIKFVDFTVDEIEKSDYDLGEGLMTNEEKAFFDLLRDTVIYFNDMSDEISKVLRYYLSRNANNKIDVVYYYGAAMSNPNMFEFFSKNVDFESKRLALEDISSIIFKTDVESKVSYSNAVGGALRRRDKN